MTDPMKKARSRKTRLIWRSISLILAINRRTTLTFDLWLRTPVRANVERSPYSTIQTVAEAWKFWIKTSEIGACSKRSGGPGGYPSARGGRLFLITITSISNHDHAYFVARITSTPAAGSRLFPRQDDVALAFGRRDLQRP